MDKASAQRKAVFAVIVVALAALGVYMFMPGALGAGRSTKPPATTHHAATQPAHGAPAASNPAPAPVSSASPSAPNIYGWLPFTPGELASAAHVVTEFSAAYGTWSYSQNADAYVATMSNLIAPGLSQVLAQSYSVPGVAQARTSEKQVSTGSAVIGSLRAYGSSSMTFVVTITEKITDTAGRSQSSSQYAVTVTGVGSSWQVSDIELASQGNS
ncbi:MAG TPA: hypothetical protein VH480_07605 [Streptosporangiaceae bacterium]